jgi:predicted kinase
MKQDNLDHKSDIPEVIVMVGVPGSGKSTWIEKFLASSPKEYEVVSSDAVLEKIAREKGMTYAEIHDEYLGTAVYQAKQKLAEAIANHRNIIVDYTNVTKKKRRGVLQDIPGFYIKIAVVLNTPDKEVERRLKKRAEQTGKHIPDEVYKDMCNRWEAPTRTEGFDRIIKA